MPNYTQTQLLDLLEEGVPLSTVRVILRHLLTQGGLQNQFPIGSRLTVHKHPSNSNFFLLEINDMVSGYATPTQFIDKARFKGGDPTNWVNFEIYTQSDNIVLS